MKTATYSAIEHTKMYRRVQKSREMYFALQSSLGLCMLVVIRELGPPYRLLDHVVFEDALFRVAGVHYRLRRACVRRAISALGVVPRRPGANKTDKDRFRHGQRLQSLDVRAGNRYGQRYHAAAGVC